MVKRKEYFKSTERYEFDWGMCSISEGFAQVDTWQDASYFGMWANPETLTIVCYCEGDVSITTAETPQEFVEEILKIKTWSNENADNGFKGIDTGWTENNPIEMKFKALGLGELVH